MSASPAEACFAVVTGGGTAGHVLPALAVLSALEERGHPQPALHYVGARRGIETTLVPPTGVPHTFLDVVGVQRRFAPAALAANLLFLPKLWRAYLIASRLLRTLGPKVVVSVGGYASLPTVLAARRRHISVVVVSYDRRPGRASTLTARFAAACAVAFPDSPLPRHRVTGAPIRSEVLAVDRERDRTSARAALGVPEDRFLVCVTGGSLGSRALNDAVASYVDQHVDDSGIAVRHVVGERFLEDATPLRNGSDGILYHVIGFEDHMDQVYAATDVLVGRGGASTVAEVAATGTPSVLVPWAAAADDHQTANVQWLAEAGASVLLPEADLASLPDVLDRLQRDPDERSRMGSVARGLGEVHRSGALIDLVEEVAGP